MSAPSMKRNGINDCSNGVAQGLCPLSLDRFSVNGKALHLIDQKWSVAC